MFHHLIHAYLLPAWGNFVGTVVDPNYWLFLVALAGLQLLWPAQRHQRRPSVAVAEDVAWFCFSTALGVTVVAGSLALLGTAYQRLTGGWSFDLIPVLGVWGVAAFAFVVSDGLAWASHWLHHHVRVLWLCHAVHHSQANLNVLSDNRQHIVETMVSSVLAFVPALILGLNSPDALKLAFSTIYVSAFIHTNVRTDLGPLRYIFISPQVHRVHHSIHPEDFNTNYGTCFAFWDYLFGTRTSDRHAYPKTGIGDQAFPRASSLNPLSLVRLFLRQTAYPFKLMPKGIAAYAGNEALRDPAPAVGTPT